MADLIIEHCRKNKLTWHDLGDIAEWDYEYVREILLGEVDDKAFCELKEIAEALGINGLEKLRYNQLKTLMAAHYISRTELAEHIGVSPNTITNWAKNASQPRIDELYAMAAFFRCCPTELLG
ncbi:helix-turn-helix transcriptional regulator [Chitinophaga niabensis]|uniref:DNA-binding transcriptional regulator, XRE-family HTH domain n=1 Tax=Chitinophaga niabensis TaxID=536979 RepID=A0A1N6E408_9BACT|nr:helix-turn-helix transcriptional regulator [Chitinophaga niabensis]SIN77667.1 DNA-binding transcriptional regulator, XRE-family HTH domain [Chitinophaga niabensis]